MNFSEKAGLYARASQAFAKWCEDAFAVRDLYEKAGLPVPPPLALFIAGEAPAVPAPPKSHVTIHGTIGIEAPYARPEGVPEHWISVALPDALMISRVQVELYKEEPLRAVELVERLKNIGRPLMVEQIATIGSRLRKHGVIDSVRADGWKLRDRAAALREIDGRIWGPKEMFSDMEVAAHRLEAIEHVFKRVGPMTPADLANILEYTLWIEPAAKHLVYTDLKKLKRNGVVWKSPKSGKWELVEKGSAMLRFA